MGSGQEISIRELTSLIRELTGFSGEIEWDSSKPNGQPRRCLDTTRAEREFGFKAEATLRTGLKETIAWYKETLPTPSALPELIRKGAQEALPRRSVVEPTRHGEL